MSEKLNWKFDVQVVGGPTLAASGEQTVDAYSKSQVVVPARSGSTDGTIELSLSTSDASILMVRASKYVEPDTTPKILKYAVKTATSTNTAVEMKGPLLMIGESSISLLGTDVVSLIFTNPMSSQVTIDTLIGVDATPIS